MLLPPSVRLILADEHVVYVMVMCKEDYDKVG